MLLTARLQVDTTGLARWLAGAALRSTPVPWYLIEDILLSSTCRPRPVPTVTNALRVLAFWHSKKIAPSISTLTKTCFPWHRLLF